MGENEEKVEAMDPAAQEALEKSVAARKAQAEKRQRMLKEQLEYARRQQLTATPGVDSAAELARIAREAQAKGVDGDKLACEMGAGREHWCFWKAGFIPGLVATALAAVLSLVLVDRAVDSMKLSTDGESAAFFVTALLLPTMLAMAACVISLGRAVRAAGSRGYWRALAGYLVGAALTASALFLYLVAEEESVRMILYRG